MLSQAMNRILVWVAACCLLLAGCGKKKVKLRVPPAPVAGSTVRGVASWYGIPYHGRASASGEIFDMEAMVAAHRTMSFQTWVRVRNLSNNKTVDVRIIDRGPFIEGRMIDLSRAAARQIELLGPGIAQVEITVISAPVNPEAALFAVQVGVFREKANADRMVRSMTAAYGVAKAVERQESPGSWRILAGRELSQEAAEMLARRIREEQNVRGAFVVRLDP